MEGKEKKESGYEETEGGAGKDAVNKTGFTGAEGGFYGGENSVGHRIWAPWWRGIMSDRG